MLILFVIYTMLGSLLMLVAIFYLYTQYGAVTGEYTLDLMRLEKLVLPQNAQVYCFAAFALAFAIKVPLFPLHTWLPRSGSERSRVLRRACRELSPHPWTIPISRRST